MLTEQHIHSLVHRFYDRVRQDPTLAPVFDAEIQDHWDSHLATMCDFWSALLLGTNRFEGRPLAKHLRLADRISPQHFDRWLVLFAETADAELPTDVAATARLKAHNIAQAFQHHMFTMAPTYARSGSVSSPSTTARATS